jgi:nucleotide-binding universal stress UspA family protein
MNVTHILHPTDFTECSKAALDYTMTIARHFGAKVSMVYVMDDLNRTGGWYVPHISLDGFYKEMCDNAEKKLESAAFKLKDLKDVKTAILRGDPATEIVRFAEKEGVDMVIMGTVGREGMDAVFGSTTQKVVRGVKCPVLCVKTRPCLPK